ncbi:ABC-2 type transport system permease protein [Saccharothrix saharensis]|uniref:ABC-2 type transport system permease protein n=1 Tax=Saccharothrix saharensis TaxID=571190 RepID=A0A543JNZ6_9PSEU|nr:ABC transporter permease [Saccharothrix saharensis]TQM84591.1 ABC-2 type transport system permease protein [Saccharothrix saharensis]
MLKIVNTEWKLFLREPSMVVFAIFFPTILLLVLGAIPALRTPDPNFDNLRFVDAYVGTLVVIALAFLGLNKLPSTVATYREKGVLRRFSTTPVHPARLLVAQVLVNVIAGVISIVLLMVVCRVVFDIDLPHHPLGFLVTCLLGMLSLSALGLLVAAWAPNARAAGGWATVVFMLVMFFGGAYLPRFLMPEFLVRVGEYLPPGVGALQEAWLGAAPDPVQLGVLALVTLAAGTVAAKSFRWE